MGRGPEWTFVQTRCTDGQWAHEKMLNHQRNVNEVFTSCKWGKWEKQWGITLYWSEWLSSQWSQMRSVGEDVETRGSQHTAAAAKSLQLCPTLCDPMNRSTPGLPVHHQLPEFTQTHAHRVGDAIQPSHPLSSPCPPAPNPSQHQGLFQWVNSSHEVAKVLEFQLQHQSFQWTPRTDLL